MAAAGQNPCLDFDLGEAASWSASAPALIVWGSGWLLSGRGFPLKLSAKDGAYLNQFG